MKQLNSTASEPERAPKPFVIENFLQDQSGNGSFQPAAAVKFTSGLRTSGLLHALPGEDLKNLLLVLTFLHPNGWCQPTVFELAHAMRVSEAKARDRMRRLVAFDWAGQPLVTELRRESGMDGFAPSPIIIDQTAAPSTVTQAAQPPVQVASRDEVIAYSREHYARPRAEVEREMAIRMGWPLPEELAAREASQPTIEEDAEHAEARRRLLGVNVASEEVERLLSTYPIERILQQLLWLPHRNAKSKSRFIVAAIDGDYDDPGTPRFR